MTQRKSEPKEQFLERKRVTDRAYRDRLSTTSNPFRAIVFRDSESERAILDLVKGTVLRIRNRARAKKNASQGNGAYKSWLSMHQRCSNPNHPHYKDYGGRGIRICKRWDSFEKFLQDVGPRLEGTSIDRIDNEGDYTPSNCKWSTPTEQAKNRRPPRKRNATVNLSREALELAA